MFSQVELNQYRNRLSKLMDRLGGDTGQVREEVLRPGGGEASGGISNAPLHLGDLGSHQAEEEVDLHLLENEEYTMKEIGAALERIDQGTFGRCENCGQAIDKERLQVVPYSRYCIRCAEKLEK